MENTDIFNSEFINTESQKILQALKEDGIFSFKNAVNENFLNKLLTGKG